jgi:hypothetical protein
MANEITVRQSLSVKNGNFIVPDISGNASRVTQNVIGGSMPVVTIGFAAAEQITFPDIADLGFVLFKNLDDTNFVQWGTDATGFIPVGKMLPGEVAGPFRADPTLALWMQADTAACKVQIIALED